MKQFFPIKKFGLLEDDVMINDNIFPYKVVQFVPFNLKSP